MLKRFPLKNSIVPSSAPKFPNRLPAHLPFAHSIISKLEIQNYPTVLCFECIQLHPRCSLAQYSYCCRHGPTRLHDDDDDANDLGRTVQGAGTFRAFRALSYLLIPVVWWMLPSTSSVHFIISFFLCLFASKKGCVHNTIAFCVIPLLTSHF